jgi:hypothetical protein
MFVLPFVTAICNHVRIIIEKSTVLIANTVGGVLLTEDELKGKAKQAEGKTKEAEGKMQDEWGKAKKKLS